MATNAEEGTRAEAPAEVLAVALLVDESYSIHMYGLTGAVIDGANEYVGELARDDAPMRVSLTKFADRPRVVAEEAAPRDVPRLTHESYRPDGNTALYDTVAATIRALDRLEEGARRLVVCVTDGEDTCSRRCSAGELARMVREREERGCWTFVYLGLGRSEEQVLATARTMGYADGNSMFVAAATPRTTARSFKNVADATRSYSERGTLSSSSFYSDAAQDPADYNAGDD